MRGIIVIFFLLMLCLPVVCHPGGLPIEGELSVGLWGSLSRTQLYPCQHLLGVECEVALHHPAVVAGITTEHFLQGDALLLAEVKHLHALVVVYDASCKVHIVGMR